MADKLEDIAAGLSVAAVGVGVGWEWSAALGLLAGGLHLSVLVLAAMWLKVKARSTDV